MKVLYVDTDNRYERYCNVQALEFSDIVHTLKSWGGGKTPKKALGVRGR